MASIYNIADFVAGSSSYIKNDIVYCGPCGNAEENSGHQFYYTAPDNTYAAKPGYSAQTVWGGRTNHNGSNKPHFFWKPSYSANINKRPRVKSIRFGDGYEQRVADGINNNLNVIDITFENRDEREAAAILHFLEERKGTESFVFEPAKPYDKASLYVCRNWDSNFVFYDNYNIKVQFEEVPE